MKILTYDIGTSAVKVSLFSEEGLLLSSVSSNLTTKVEGRKVTQDPQEWWEKFLSCARQCLQEVNDGEEITIVGTGQMEDLILLDEEGNPLTDASLYSDSNIGDYELPQNLKATIESKIPNQLDSFTPLVKMFYLSFTTQLLAKASYVLLGAKDYINFKLTGESWTDPTNAATTGLFDCNLRTWVAEAADCLSLDLLPRIGQPYEEIGRVKIELLPLLGFKTSSAPLVLNGVGDLGAVTLGAGIFEVGDSYFYLGTTGWSAVLSQAIAPNRDLFSLAGFREGEWVVVAPLLNLGNVYDWALETFFKKRDYQQGEKALKNKAEVNLQVWPYLNGERNPYRNNKVRSVITRVTQGTSGEELFAAYARSLIFALRHVSEYLGVDSDILRLTGGLTRLKGWCQLLSDVFQRKSEVVKDETLAPQKGLYYLYLMSKGMPLPAVEIEKVYHPRENKALEELYQEYKQLAELLLQGKGPVSAYLE